MLRILCTAFLLVCSAGVSRSEIVSNGGFEQRDPQMDRPAHWHHNARNATDIVRMGWSDEAGHSGNHSISIHILEGSPPEKSQISWMWTSEAHGLVVGETYRLSAWIKTRGLGFTPTVIVQFRNSEDEFLSRADTHTGFPLTGTVDWTEVSSEFVVPPQTTHVKIRAIVKSHDNAGGSVWFDDISVQKVER